MFEQSCREETIQGFDLVHAHAVPSPLAYRLGKQAPKTWCGISEVLHECIDM